MIYSSLTRRMVASAFIKTPPCLAETSLRSPLLVPRSWRGAVSDAHTRKPPSQSTGASPTEANGAQSVVTSDFKTPRLPHQHGHVVCDTGKC